MQGILIANPFASGVTESRLAGLREILGDDVTLQLTEGPGHAVELARAAAGRVEAIFVFSGDGVYNEVLNGVDDHTPLGFLPGGGTSVLARALGLPRDPLRAAELLTRGQRRVIGVGRVNGRRFGFSAGIGFDAELVRRVDALGRRDDGRRPGDVAFVKTIVRTLAASRFRIDPVLEIEGYGRAAFALVANCNPYTYAGPVGLAVAPRASFEGGLDVVGVRAVAPHTIPRLAWTAFRGAHEGGSTSYGHDLDRIVIRADVPQPVHVDGEDLGDLDLLEIDAERDAVTVLVGPAPLH
jgi:diacylglycerol kinase family enzyme